MTWRGPGTEGETVSDLFMHQGGLLMRTPRVRTPRARSRSKLLALFAALTVIGTLGIAPVLAVHDDGKFELDKNTSNDTNIFRLGDLAANITATATSLNICQTSDGSTLFPNPPTPPFLIQLEAERMTVNANNSGCFGGNCLGTKRT